jgi:hypothetical protein
VPSGALFLFYETAAKKPIAKMAAMARIMTNLLSLLL